jgi:hypothetical protein
MLNKPSFVIVGEIIILTLQGQTRHIGPDHPHHAKILKKLRHEDWLDLETLMDVKQSIYTFTEGCVTITPDGVCYDGEKVANAVVPAILDMMRQGLPVDPLGRFFGKLMENPSKHSVDQFWNFVENNTLTIHPDGDVLMYKGVTDDYKDNHTKTFDNSIGQILEMRRNSVVDDPEVSCDEGFHAGGFGYVKSFSQRKMIVKINPKDVVSVPNDSASGKVRVCRYEVIAEYEAEIFKKAEPHKNPIISYDNYEVIVAAIDQVGDNAYTCIKGQFQTPEDAEDNALEAAELLIEDTSHWWESKKKARKGNYSKSLDQAHPGLGLDPDISLVIFHTKKVD